MDDRELIRTYISVDPAIQHGKPCLKGMRVPVYVILEALATGLSTEDVQREFGPMPREALLACLSYAALLANEEELVRQPT